MRKVKTREQQSRKQRNRVGTFDRLEDRCLLAPVVLPSGGTEFEFPLLSGTYLAGGFTSVRLISSQTGRLEADPTGAFGNDVFVVSRGTPPGSGGLVPNGANPGDQPGFIYRVDPYAVDNFGSSAGANRRLFATVPGGGSSFGGYENWFDLAFDVTGNFDGVNGGPTLFVSTLDSATTVGINPRNAVYAFRPDGSLVTPTTPTNPTGVYAYSTRDVVKPGVLDTQLGAIAVAPGDTFGRNLFIMDVACDNEVGVSCSLGDGNAIFHVFPSQPDPVDIELPPSPINRHVEDTLPPITPTPINNDIDVRAMIFDPNRGIILQGQFGEPAYQLWGGLFMASTDLESGDTGRTRLLHFPSPSAAPLDLIPPVPVQQRMIGDMAFDPVGFWGGGIFFTDYVTGAVFQVLQDPTTGLGFTIPVIAGFNVLTPTQFLPTDPPGITPQEAYRDAFSISFSADGEILYVSDRDGVWAFYANTLAHTAAGTTIGLTDMRELRVPYTGQGFAAAVMDSGVDGAHLGFQNTVAAGWSPAIGRPGNFDFFGHGTAVAGIIHQIVPDTIIQPLNLLFGSANSYFLNQSVYDSAKFILDNPFVDDPRTPGINEALDSPLVPGDERIPVVALNMSIGIRSGPDENLISDAFAVKEAPSVTIPLKTIFQNYRNPKLTHSFGIVPVASSSNSGQLFGGMSGSNIPGILNETVEVAATYPYDADLDIFAPGAPVGPPITIDFPPGSVNNLRCTLEAGDLAAYVGKLTAFSNRNITTDYAAPGTCVSSYARSGFLINQGQPLGPQFQSFLTGPITPVFNGTSAAAPIVTGQFVFGFDVIAEWVKVAAAGGTISPTAADEGLRKLNQYLTRDLGLTTTVALGAVPSLAAYLNQDGINSILQWTAIPREDVNLGESFDFPNGLEDDVEQKRLINSTLYRTYSHSNLANFLSAVEGTISLNYFLTHPGELAALTGAAGTPGVITTADIDAYVASPLHSASARAMARLLGGTDRIARVNRFVFLDVVQDGRQDGGITTADLAALAEKLLPEPDEFVITKRRDSAEKGYALDEDALRAYHDFIYRPDMVFSEKIPNRLRKKSPDQFRLGLGAGNGNSFLPIINGDKTPDLVGRTPQYQVIGRGGDAGSPFAPLPGTNPPSGLVNNGGANIQTGGNAQVNNFVTLNDQGSEFIYRTDANGNLVEHARQANGTWTITNVTAAASGRKINSDVIALDMPGASTRSVFGLTADGHVVRYDHAGGSWTATDMTAAFNLVAINSSLAGVVLNKSTGAAIMLYGLNQSGQLIEYRQGKYGWVSTNLGASLSGSNLVGNVVGWGQPLKKKEQVFVYGTSADGHVHQFVWNGKRWGRLDLSTGASPRIAANGVVIVPSTRGVPSMFALDTEGELWSYSGLPWLGWQSITAQTNGPRLVGELSAHLAAGSGTAHIFGRDSSGRIIQYSGQHQQWSYTALDDSTIGSGDIAASTNYRAVYTELVDGALAELWLGADWNARVLEDDSDTAGASDGSNSTTNLIQLAVASR